MIYIHENDRAIEAFTPSDPQPYAGIKRWWREFWLPPLSLTSSERAEEFERLAEIGRRNFPDGFDPRRRMSPLALRLMAISNAFRRMR